MDALTRDKQFMQRALDLAASGLGRVEPNPMVGAVVVAGDQIVGEGFHARFGGPHAEVVALDAAGPRAQGAELFVSLEPCCHHGKTPPCTDAILSAGVRRVVAAVEDPFPQVAGRGQEILRQAGVLTQVGLLEEQARRLNAAFFKRQKTGHPLVIAKWAMTLDGRLASASGNSRWISSEESRRRVHEVRRVVDAVLVGAGTVAADSPSLTVRLALPLPERGQPARVILDSRLATDPAREPARSAREVPVIIYTSEDAISDYGDRASALREAGCELVTVAAPMAGAAAAQPEAAPRRACVAADAVIADLGARGMSRVLVEGGARIFGSFFAGGLVDRVMIFVSPRILGSVDALGPVAGPSGRPLADAFNLLDMSCEKIGPDLLIQGRLGEF
jgi:diaminohydroxyphosphoribosylaminopyrimidine deaminase / 5-amino-6-(5-phosphoribosylamino)uracil reductase